MNLNKLILMVIILLTIVTVSGVSAQDNATFESSNDDRIINEYPDSSSDNLIVNITSQDEDLDVIQSENQNLENFTIEFYDDYNVYGETNIFGFVMPKDIENKVSVAIDGKEYDYEIYSIDDHDLWVWGGDAKTQNGYMVKFFDLKPGNHEVVITYYGDGKYTKTSLEKTIAVEGKPVDKVPSKLTADNITAYYNSGKNLIATLSDENGNPIKNADINIKINGEIQQLKTDSHGQVKLTTNNLPPKGYTATITYECNDSFKASAVKVKVTIKKAISKITAIKKTFKKSLKTKKYTITLKANNKAMKNKVVTLKVNKKTYTAKTNSKGKATFKITKLAKKGTFNAIVKICWKQMLCVKNSKY